MVSFNYKITDPVGIHARPAGLLVKEAKNFSSKIVINANGKSADATKLMAIMGLGVKTGTEVTVEISGDDENNALVKLEEFFKTNF